MIKTVNKPVLTPFSISTLFTIKNAFIVFFIAWGLLLWLSPTSWQHILDYALFSLLGVLGAIFANSTGAGGGVIFIPFFNQLAFTEQQAIATSFAIQCFGMTAGAITWSHFYKQQKTPFKLWQGYKRIIFITTIFSAVGLWLVYLWPLKAQTSLSHSFSWFSLILGAAILCSMLLSTQKTTSKLTSYDWFAFVLIGFFGGMITAWLSVGVGEILAIYLILRRFDIMMAVATAVVVSAFTVWIGIAQHTLVQFDVYWQVVVFAGPGAVLGGVLAKTLVTYLSARKLKIFFSFWLLLTGFLGIV